ncbi:MAG: polysaccharide biosynthesis protein [Parcubacteria group bacterium Gr01-1014_2]|nr:MAG: polysaccharide biosynthesis protein [Parcubacteria group bacterium Gr01-1014_2]
MSNLLKKIIKLATRYTKIDMDYVVKSSLWTSIDFTVGSVLSMILVVISANFLPKETYGIYKYILSLVGALSFLTLSGINTAVIQATAKSGNNGILPYAVKLQFKWNFLYTLVMAGLGIYYFLNGNNLLAYALWLMAVLFPLDAVFNTYGSFLAGKKEFKRVSIYSSISNTIQMSVLITAALLSDNVILLIGVYSLFRIVPNFYFYLKTVSIFRPQPLDQSEKKEIFRFARHLSFVHILSILAQHVDKIVVFHYLGAVQLAVYGIAISIPERIRGYFKSIETIMLPKISGKTVEEIKAVFNKRIWQGILLGSTISLAYIVLIFIIPATYFSNVVKGHKMIKVIYASSLGANIFRIILYITLGKLWGIWGIISATLSLYFFGIIYNFILWEIEMKRRKIS